MGVKFDRWTFLKLIELICVTACLIYNRITNDEAGRVQLYLQRISREWSLLNNVTWSRIGAAVADATYGGYLVITGALFVGRLVGELPTHRRVTEFILLATGTVLFIVLGSLEFASLDSVPPSLVDNAAVIGTLSVVTGALFLLDMGGPKGQKPAKPQTLQQAKISRPKDLQTISKDIPPAQDVDIEQGFAQVEKRAIESAMRQQQDKKNGHAGKNGVKKPEDPKQYKQLKEDSTKRFGIYGKDVVDFGQESEDEELPPKMEQLSPVWSNIRKGQYGKYDIVRLPYHHQHQRDEGFQEDDRPPSGPGDPGYVQYTAQHWGQPIQKTPRTSPTQV